MIQENELISLLIGVLMLIFILANRLRLKRLPASGIFIAGFYLLLAGLILTILKAFFLGDLLNFLEHVSYAASSVLLLIWCWKVFVKERGEVNR